MESMLIYIFNNSLYFYKRLLNAIVTFAKIYKISIVFELNNNILN